MDNLPNHYQTRDQAWEWLIKNGFPIGRSTFDKLCAPAAVKARRPRQCGRVVGAEMLSGLCMNRRQFLLGQRHCSNRHPLICKSNCVRRRAETGGN